MMRATIQAGLVLAAMLAAAPGCGPACLDDRCSLKTAAPRVDRFEPPTHSDAGTSGSVAMTSDPAQGSAAAGSAAGSGSGSAAGSAAGPAAGPAAQPTPLPPAGPRLEWLVFDNLADNSRTLVVTKNEVPAGTLVKFELTKLPDKTPFAIFLDTKQGGSSQSEAKWNDCPPDKLRCDVVGTKSYVTKRAGRISLQARTNWAITGFVGDPTAYLVTWTNSLTREALTLRLSR
jgi:hypothetical protein